MDVSEFLTGTFLRADDLAAGPRTFTIKAVDKKDLGDGQKVVVAFHEDEKELTCNKTRLKILVKMFGPETATWINQKITLFAQPIVSGKFAGQSTISIMPTQQQQPPAQQQEVVFPVQ